MVTDNPDFKAEHMEIDMLCDQCQKEIKKGDTAYVSLEKGQVVCEECATKK